MQRKKKKIFLKVLIYFFNKENETIDCNFNIKNRILRAFGDFFQNNKMTSRSRDMSITWQGKGTADHFNALRRLVLFFFFVPFFILSLPFCSFSFYLSFFLSFPFSNNQSVQLNSRILEILPSIPGAGREMAGRSTGLLDAPPLSSPRPAPPL